MIITGQLVRNQQHRSLDSGGDNAVSASRSVQLVPGYIKLDGPRIAEVVQGEIAEHADLGGPDCVICPGFIDTHLHLPQFDIIGAHGLPLLQWLSEVTFPAERRWADPSFAQAMTHRVIDQCFAHGTTAMGAYATVHHEGTLAALEVAKARHVRGVIGQVLMDRNAPDELIRSAAKQIDETRRLLDLYPPQSALAAAVTPRFAVSCSDKLLSAAGELATERHAHVQTHLAETRDECEVVQREFGGMQYVDVYREAGLLTSRSILGHGIYLDATDRRTLHDSGSIIAHCPTANSFLRSGAMSLADLQHSQVQVSLGSDIGAGYERSMMRVARAMIETAAMLGDTYPSAAEAIWHITHGNALALGWPDRDRLSTDEPADVLVIQPDIVWRDTNDAVDPLSKLLFAWDDRWLKTTIVAGSIVYQSPAGRATCYPCSTPDQHARLSE